MRATVEHRRLRGHTELKDRARKAAANNRALTFTRALVHSLEGQDPELVIEVCRVLIRCLSRIVETKGDIGRAQGVLAGAATDLSPAFRPEPKGKAEAEALFGGSAA